MANANNNNNQPQQSQESQEQPTVETTGKLYVVQAPLGSCPGAPASLFLPGDIVPENIFGSKENIDRLIEAGVIQG